MINHKNIHYTYNGIATLQFPNGMRFKRDSEIEGEDIFQLVSPDGTLRLCIEFFSSTKSARELIEELNDSTEHDVFCPPRAIRTPAGLDGYMINYSVGEDCYEECTLDFEGDVRANFWFLYKAGMPYDKALYEQVKAELLENIKMV